MTSPLAFPGYALCAYPGCGLGILTRKSDCFDMRTLGGYVGAMVDYRRSRIQGRSNVCALDHDLGLRAGDNALLMAIDPNMLRLRVHSALPEAMSVQSGES